MDPWVLSELRRRHPTHAVVLLVGRDLLAVAVEGERVGEHHVVGPQAGRLEEVGFVEVLVDPDQFRILPGS